MDQETYTKIDAVTFEAVVPVPTPPPVRQTHTLDGLQQHRDALVARKESAVATFDAEIAEIDALIARGREIGVKTQVEIDTALVEPGAEEAIIL